MKSLLIRLSRSESLDADGTYEAFRQLTETGDGAASDAQIGAYLFAGSVRLPTSAELVGAARFLRENMIAVDLSGLGRDAQTLDTCGTGGSGLQSFNTSTAAAFVCAAAGVYVTKHGNRGASSACGSVDLLEALGVKFDLPPHQIADCCIKTGFGFMFAPKHHPATARVARIRKELGIPTIFNFLGPLVNPARAAYQVLGVSRKNMVPVMAQALAELGCKRAMVVHGEDGLDEITLGGRTWVHEISGGKTAEYFIRPEDFGLDPVPNSEIRCGTPEFSAQTLQRMFAGEPSAYRDLVLLNAGAGLYICGKFPSIEAGIAGAAESIDSGKAQRVLDSVVAVTNGYS